MTTPVNNGTNELSWNQAAIQIYREMLAKGDKQLAAAWLKFYPAFHQKNPQYTPDQALQAFLDTELATGLQTGISAVGSNLSNAVSATANSANSLPNLQNPLNYLKYVGNFFGALTQPETYIRIAEGLAGALLLYLGLKAAMTPGGVAPATRSAKQTFTETGKKVAKLVIK